MDDMRCLNTSSSATRGVNLLVSNPRLAIAVDSNDVIWKPQKRVWASNDLFRLPRNRSISAERSSPEQQRSVAKRIEPVLVIANIEGMGSVGRDRPVAICYMNGNVDWSGPGDAVCASCVEEASPHTFAVDRCILIEY